MSQVIYTGDHGEPLNPEGTLLQPKRQPRFELTPEQLALVEKRKAAAAWNKEVDARKAAKRAAKKGKP